MSLGPINSTPAAAPRTTGSLGQGGLGLQLDARAPTPDAPSGKSASDGDRRADGENAVSAPTNPLMIDGADINADAFHRDARATIPDARGSKTSSSDDRRADNTVESDRIVPTPARGLSNTQVG